MSLSLHHVAFTSPAAPAAVEFYRDEWGLREAGRQGRTVRLASAKDGADGYSLVITEAPVKSVHHFCLATGDRAQFDAVADLVRERGVRVLEDVDGCPGMTDSFWVVDLEGRRVEIGYRPGMDDEGADGEPADAVPLKPGHIVLNTPDIVAATAWYEENLGFRVRDWRTKKMSFLYYNKDHHTVAFNSAPYVSLNHVAYELADLNQFFRAVGRISGSARARKLYGPGRHGPGEYVFCYFQDPMGFICEYETDGVKVEHPEDYEFRVWEFTPENTDQWLGALSGGVTQEFRKASVGEPDPGLVRPE